MKNYNTQQIFIKLNHQFMHQQKIVRLRQASSVQQQTTFCSLVYSCSDNVPSPQWGGQGKVRVSAQRSRACLVHQVWVQSVQ